MFSLGRPDQGRGYAGVQGFFYHMERIPGAWLSKAARMVGGVVQLWTATTSAVLPYG